MGTDLKNCNPALARRILAQMQAEDAGKLRPIQPPAPLAQKPKAPQLLRQKAKGPNKLEAAFAAVLRAENPGVQIREQAVTLLLANNCRYTPDMMIVEPGRLEAYETKGHMRDDASVKLKVAASVWPQITFWLVWRKAGVWHRQRILA